MLTLSEGQLNHLAAKLAHFFFDVLITRIYTHTHTHAAGYWACPTDFAIHFVVRRYISVDRSASE